MDLPWVPGRHQQAPHAEGQKQGFLQGTPPPPPPEPSMTFRAVTALPKLVRGGKGHTPQALGEMEGQVQQRNGPRAGLRQGLRQDHGHSHD